MPIVNYLYYLFYSLLHIKYIFIYLNLFFFFEVLINLVWSNGRNSIRKTVLIVKFTRSKMLLILAYIQFGIGVCDSSHFIRIFFN